MKMYLVLHPKGFSREPFFGIPRIYQGSKMTSVQVAKHLNFAVFVEINGHQRPFIRLFHPGKHLESRVNNLQ